VGGRRGGEERAKGCGAYEQQAKTKKQSR